MITIEKVTLRIIEMPLVTPFETASARIDKKALLLLEATDKDGVTAFSECVAKQIPNYSPETVDTALIMLKKHILPLVLHQSFESPEAMMDTLSSHIRGNLMAIATVDMVAWAITAIKNQQSLSQCIGGTKDRVDCGVSIGIQHSPQELVDVIKKEQAEGYQKIKCKIKPGKDVDYLTHVRSELGDSVPLMADANNAYTLDDFSVLQQLDTLGLMMIEQPLAWDDIAMHAHLQPKMKTPICLDESIFHVNHAKLAIELGATQIINIKPGRVGGFTESIRIHDHCAKHNIPVWCGGMLETGIGRAYNIALASMPNFKLPGDTSPSKRYWHQDIVSPEWVMDANGQIAVPTGVGLGVDIDIDRIESFTIHCETIS